MHEPSGKEILACSATAFFATQLVPNDFVALVMAVSITIALLTAIIWLKSDLFR